MSMTSNPSRSFTSHAQVVSTALAAAIGVTAVTLPQPAHAVPNRQTSSVAKSTQVLELNARGQESYDAGDFEAAAHSWSEILRILPENETNKAERNTQLLIMIDASIRAYEQLRGRTRPEVSVEVLRRGVATVDIYESDFSRTYGQGVRTSAEAQRESERLRTLLASAEADLPVVAPEPTPPREPTNDVLIRNKGFDPPSGVGLIVGGSLMITAGLGATSMIAVGATMNKQASRDHKKASEAEPVDEAGQDAADDKGRTGTALLVTGSVLTGVFLAGGATMLGIGIKRRIRYLAFSPTTGQGFVGVSLRGRF